MKLTKLEAIMFFSAIVELNESERVVEILGEEKAVKVVEHISGVGDNITPKERREMAENLLVACCDFILSDVDSE